MHSRVTLLEIDVLRVDVDAAVERYRQEIIPQLRVQPGFEGVYVMVSEEGKGLIMTLWASREAMEGSTPIAGEALARFVTLFRAPPGREHYDVRIAERAATVVQAP